MNSTIGQITGLCISNNFLV